MTTPDNPRPVDGAPLVEPSRPRSLFQEKLDILEKLQSEARHAADPRVLEAQREVDIGVRTARQVGLIADTEHTLSSYYSLIRQTVNNPVEEDKVVNSLLARMDPDRLKAEEAQDWEIGGYPATHRDLFEGVQVYVARRGLVRLLRERAELKGKVLAPMPYRRDATGQAGEWDLEMLKNNIELAEKASRETGHKFRPTERADVYRLVAERPEEIYPALKDLINYFEADLQSLPPDVAVQQIQARVQIVINSFTDAAARLGLSDDERKKMRFLTQARFGMLGAKMASDAGNLEVFKTFLGEFFAVNAFESHIDALIEDLEGLPYVAIALLEEEDGQYFRPEGRDGRFLTDIEGGKNQQNENKDKIKARLAGFKLRGKLSEIGFEKAESELLKGFFTHDINQQNLFTRILGEKDEDRKKDLIQVNNADQRLKEVNEAFDVAERLLVILGATSRYAGPRVITYNPDGSIKEVTAFEAVVKRRIEEKARNGQGFKIMRALKSTVPVYTPSLAGSDQTRRALAGILGTDKKTSAFKVSEQERREYYQVVSATREENRGNMVWGEGGSLGHRRLYALPEHLSLSVPGTKEGIGEDPEELYATDLFKATELYVRDFLLEQGCWTLREMMGRLKRKDKAQKDKEGTLIGIAEPSTWLGRLAKAADQRTRFIGGNVGNKSYIGLILGPLDDPWKLKNIYRKNDVNSSQGQEAALRTTMEVFGQVIDIASGFSYLDDRVKIGAGRYSSQELINKLRLWIYQSPSVDVQFPKGFEYDRKAIREVMSDSTGTKNFLQIALRRLRLVVG